MQTENNKKEFPLLATMLWFLWGILVLWSTVALQESWSFSNIAFVTQQYMVWGANSNAWIWGKAAGSNTNGGAANGSNTNGGAAANGSNTNGGAANGWSNPNVIWTANGLNALQSKIITIFSYYNTIPNGNCSITQWTWSNQWSVSYDSSSFASEQYVFCALRDTTLNIVLQASSLNQFNGSFNNIIPGNYAVECYALSRSSFGFKMQMCKSNFVVWSTGWSAPTSSWTTIDLELWWTKITNANAWPPIPWQPISSQYSYWFSIINNPSASTSASGATLKVTYKNLVSVTASGAVCTGNTCIFSLPVLAPWNGIKVVLEWSAPGITQWGNLEVFGELCDYNNDTDSTACNMSNSLVTEDDEVKL